MKNASDLEVVASIKDMNTDLNREFEVGSEEYNQASRGFCPSKTSNLLRVVNYCNAWHENAIIYRSYTFPYKFFQKSHDINLEYEEYIKN